MSVLAHVKVTPSTIPQLSNRPIMMALLDQCVNYYYSNWPLGLKGYEKRETEKSERGGKRGGEGDRERNKEGDRERIEREGKRGGEGGERGGEGDREREKRWGEEN